MSWRASVRPAENWLPAQRKPERGPTAVDWCCYTYMRRVWLVHVLNGSLLRLSHIKYRYIDECLMRNNGRKINAIFRSWVYTGVQLEYSRDGWIIFIYRILESVVQQRWPGKERCKERVNQNNVNGSTHNKCELLAYLSRWRPVITPTKCLIFHITMRQCMLCDNNDISRPACRPYTRSTSVLPARSTCDIVMHSTYSLSRPIDQYWLNLITVMSVSMSCRKHPPTHPPRHSKLWLRVLNITCYIYIYTRYFPSISLCEISQIVPSSSM